MKTVIFGLIILTAVAVATFGCTQSTANSGTVQSVQLPKTDLLKPKASNTGYLVSAQKVETLVLTSSNTITFRGAVSPQTVAKAQLEILAMSAKLPASATIYLVLDTPGGDVNAGREFIDTVNSLPQEVKTVTVFAASMGFQFVQHMGERLILPSAGLMSHRARLGGIGGEIPGDLVTRLNYIANSLEKLDAHDAARMGMSLEAYQELIRDEYWVDGQDAVRDRAADRLILSRCDGTFKGTEKVFLGSMFGVNVFGIMSKCPLITAVLEIQIGGGEGASEEDKQKAKAAFSGYSNRRMFVQKYLSEVAR